VNFLKLLRKFSQEAGQLAQQQAVLDALSPGMLSLLCELNFVAAMGKGEGLRAGGFGVLMPGTTPGRSMFKLIRVDHRQRILARLQSTA
jgi:hypothetical protein